MDLIRRLSTGRLSEVFGRRALESDKEQAVVPRILVDPALIESISSEEKNLIVVEGDKYFVDFAPHLINRGGNKFDDVQAEMTELNERLQAEQNDRVKSKIQWLLDYYHWTIDANKSWDGAKFISYRSGIKRGFQKLQ